MSSGSSRRPPTRSWRRRRHEPPGVNPALAGVALAVIVGAVVAGSARNARTAILGLVVAAGRARRSSPIRLPRRSAWPPASLPRCWPAICCGSRRAVRPRRTGGTLVGWPTEAFLAIAAAVVGYVSHGLGAPGLGPPVAAAAGFALAALAILPVLNGRDILRIGLGLLLLLTGALLVRTSLGGTPAELEDILTAGLVATLGGAVAILAIATPVRRPARLRAQRDDTAPLQPWRRRAPDRTRHEPGRLRRRHVRGRRPGDRAARASPVGTRRRTARVGRRRSSRPLAIDPGADAGHRRQPASRRAPTCASSWSSARSSGSG